MRFSVRINVNINQQAIADNVWRAVDKAQAALDEQILKDCNYFIPKDTGQLEMSSIINSRIGEGLLVWNTPYARRQYYGVNYNFSTDRNPNAGPLWFERAKALHFNAWKTLAQRIIDENI